MERTVLCHALEVSEGGIRMCSRSSMPQPSSPTALISPKSLSLPQPVFPHGTNSSMPRIGSIRRRHTNVLAIFDASTFLTNSVDFAEVALSPTTSFSAWNEQFYATHWKYPKESYECARYLRCLNLPHQQR